MKIALAFVLAAAPAFAQERTPAQVVEEVFLALMPARAVRPYQEPAIHQRGIASVYTQKETRGRRTASGARLSDGALTAAHRTLRFGQLIKVTNTRNGRSIVVKVTDRGPFMKGRVIDLTPAGAAALGFSGLAPVTLELVM